MTGFSPVRLSKRIERAMTVALGGAWLVVAACGEPARSAPPAATRPDARAAGDTPGSDGAAPSSPAPPMTPQPLPTRFIVLGDSIAACQGVGDKQSPTCGPKKLHAYLTAGPAPALSYENEAIPGATTADVFERELPRVRSGRGHVFVLIYVGGNDLRPYLIGPDSAAEAGFMREVPTVEAAWKKIFAFFADPAKFPDGATIVMNNQYDPFDDCTAAPYFVSAKKHSLLRAFNDLLARIAQENRALLIDQYTPYLGHGHHYALARCPHYQANAQPFMGDLIHPNVAGHDHLYQRWRKAVDGFYAMR